MATASFSRTPIKWIFGIASLFVVFAIGAIIYKVINEGLGQQLVERESRLFIKYFWTNTFGSWQLYAAFAIVFLVQKIIPVQKGELFGRHMKMDLCWTLVWVANMCILIPIYWYGLQKVFHPLGVWFASLEIGLSGWIAIVLGFLAADFMGWLHHLIRHKVRAFWEFHKIHHSQTYMNPLTTTRVHPIDQVVARTIKIIPTLFFENGLGIALGYLAFHELHDRLVHSNIKTNLGPLKYVFVTPQSHRVHHSGEKEYYDMNFGVSLSVWDHLFGTQCRNYDVYPTTGIPDPNFPCESKSEKPLYKLLWQQFVYPFSGKTEKLN
ncbi:sterol desaturase family protein [Echinimonas agarilytica]|uniref:Sterol desaturase family protein n=1 Tax=Echinimonas agarilytica TaxID=1215918 RepID=A0AA41W9A9_9GAMM|nr:sterol desaturase family protein [Echinimonas agarilytica]MCM2681484.1 sterol desaturase family protein [Echinimonas agarilytica]